MYNIKRGGKVNIVIAIDGPAGAGKSTISKIVASRLGINYIDTGAMYRAITYKCISQSVSIEDIKSIIEICRETDVDFRDNKIYLDGICVDDKIRSKDITQNVSDIAKIKEVREILVNIQRSIGKKSDVILDGRDVGTCIFPKSRYKFYLVASAEERGRRRYEEMKKKGEKISLEEVIEDIKKRDEIDSTREVSPLTKADDAIEIDTTHIKIEEVVDFIVNYVEGDNDGA